MKSIYPIALFGLAAVLAGCTTSSQVREMIDASRQDNQTQLRAHEESLDVLRLSAKAGLEKSSANARRIDELEKQVAALARQVATVQELANAAKVLSVDTTVKVSRMEERMAANKESSDKAIARMASIDKLYEEVLVRQFREIAESANAAIAALHANGFSSTTNAPVKLDAPIEIVAPDPVAAPTNSLELTR